MKPFLQITGAAQKGLTLIELMIAMALGLFLITGVLTIFVNTKQTYIDQDATSQLQENARFALEMIGREIRMAGYTGCSNEIRVANVLNGGSDLNGYPGLAADFKNGLKGYDEVDEDGNVPAWLDNASPETDAIIVHTAGGAVEGNSAPNFTRHKPLIIQWHKTKSSVIKLLGEHTINKGAILLLVDSNCSNMAIFANTINHTRKIKLKTDVTFTGPEGHTHNNCETKIRGHFTCDNPSGLSSAYSAGSSLFNLNSFAYYIGQSSQNLAGQPNNDPNIRSLYRRSMSGAAKEDSTVVDEVAEEMVEGISNMEILYGLATGSNIRYLKASDVPAAKWADVKTVRVTLTVNSLTEVEGAPLTQDFHSTIQLRNKGES